MMLQKHCYNHISQKLINKTVPIYVSKIYTNNLNVTSGGQKLKKNHLTTYNLWFKRWLNLSPLHSVPVNISEVRHSSDRPCGARGHA